MERGIINFPRADNRARRKNQVEYSFHIYNKLAKDGITMATDKLLIDNLTKKNTQTRGAGTSSRVISALKTAWKANGPTVIDVTVEKDEFVLPMLPPGGAIDDMITKVK